VRKDDSVKGKLPQNVSPIRCWVCLGLSQVVPVVKRLRGALVALLGEVLGAMQQEGDVADHAGGKCLAGRETSQVEVTSTWRRWSRPYFQGIPPCGWASTASR
jgi:hypothetical protein